MIAVTRELLEMSWHFFIWIKTSDLFQVLCSFIMAGKTYSGKSHTWEHMLAANKGFSISTLHAEEAAKEVLVPLAFRMRKK